MRIPDPKANTTTEAYLAYKAGYLEESELKPVLYEPYLHFDAWLAYWDGLTNEYPFNASGKNILQLKKYSASGIDVKLAAGGMIKVAGTTQNNYANFMTYQTPIDLKAGVYTFSRVGDKTYVVSLTVYNEDKTQYTSINITAGNSSSTANIAFDIKYIAGAFTGLTVGSSLDFVTGLQLEAGSDASEFETSTIPEMLCDEEALVAYLSGVTDTYPEDIKDPYDVRIVGYLKHLASARWPEPDYPVNNEEFYLSTMEPTHTSNPVPSSDIELDTAEGKIISVEAYGDTYQQTYSGKNIIDFTTISYSGANSGSGTRDGATFTVTGASNGNYGGIQFVQSNLQLKTDTTYTFSATVVSTTSTNGSIVYANSAMSNTGSQIYGNYAKAGERTVVTFTTPSSITNSASIRLYTGIADGVAVFTDIMVEESATATSYEPYVGGIPAPNHDYPQPIQVVTGEQTITISDGIDSEDFSISLGSIELCKIGDYQDYIYKSGDDWYVHKEVGKQTIDGTSIWRVQNDTKTNYVYYQNTSSTFIPTGVNDVAPALSTQLIAMPGSVANNSDTSSGFAFSTSGYLRANLPRVDFPNATAVKSHFTANPMDVYYALATPTDAKITDTTLVGQLEALAGADTYNEKTYIKVTATDPNLPALLKVEAYKY